MTRALLFTDVVPNDVAKLKRLAEDRGVSVVRIAALKAAKTATVNEQLVIYSSEGAAEAVRLAVKDAAKRAGVDVIEVGVRAGHPGWERVATFAGPASREDASEWRRMADSFAADVDRMKGEAARVIADRDAAKARAETADRSLSLAEAKARDMADRLDRQDSAHKREMAAVRNGTSTRMTLERNAALNEKSKAEYARDRATERAEKAEAEAAVLRRRPEVDATKLDEMKTKLDGLSGQVTRLTIRLSEMTEERDAKDDAMRKALARASATETKLEQAGRSARPARLAIAPKAPASSPTLADLTPDDFTFEQHRRGWITDAEAIEQLRKGRAS